MEEGEGREGSGRVGQRVKEENGEMGNRRGGERNGTGVGVGPRFRF